MKRLLLALLLISPFSFADWGDVYYCQMTSLSETASDGKRTDYILEKFQFKLDKDKNAMVFGNSGHFIGQVSKLSNSYSIPSRELWIAENASQFSSTAFDNGKFLAAQTTYDKIVSISADCDKF